MVNDPLISIVVPVYKVEPFLGRCVESLLAQSYEKIEIILVDDGSPDACPAMCDRFAAGDSRIKVVHKENGGLSDARNCGVSAAAGDYISFVDSDDYVSPDYAEYLLRLLDENEADIACGQLRSVYGGDELFGEQPPERTESYGNIAACRALIKTRCMPMAVACAKLLPADIVRAAPFPFGRLHEDEATTYKYYYAAGKTVLGSREIYAYYQNGDSITHTKTRRNHEAAILAFEEQCEYFAAAGCPELQVAAAERLLSTLVVMALGKSEAAREFIRDGRAKRYLRMGVGLKTKLRWYGYRLFRADLNALYHKIVGK